MNDSNYSRRASGQLSRRRLLRGAGVTSVGVAAAALIGCSSKSKPAATSGAGSAAVASPGGSISGTYTQPTSGWDKLTPAQRRSSYDGDNFRNLATQKVGPKNGFRGRYPGTTPASWSSLQAASGVIPAVAWAHNQLIQVRSDDYMDTVHNTGIWPVLAQAMPEQPDPLTYTFKLVQGVKFQNVPPVNGREMTSDDVKYSFDVYRKSPVQSSALAAVSSVDAVDKYTVQFKLSEPYAPFIATIAAPMYWIFSKEQHTTTDKSLSMDARPIGTGAWIFKKADPAAGYSFDKNPDYFRKDPRTGQQLPYMDGVDIVAYQSGAAQTSAFRTGDIDYLGGTVLNAQSFADVMKSKPKSIGEFTAESVGQLHFGMRLDKAPYKDVRFRQALSLLIDRDTLINTVLFGNGIYCSGEDWSWWGYKEGWPADRLEQWQYLKYNPTQAKQLLSAAGFDFGTTIPVFFGAQTSGIRFDVYSAAVGMLTAAGIKTTIVTTPDAASANQVLFGDKSYEGMFAWADVPPGIDPDIYTYQILKAGEPNNIYYVNDPKIDQMCVDQRHALDKTTRQKTLEGLLDYTQDQITRIELVDPDKINIRGSNVFNLTDNVNFWSIFGWGPQASDVIWKSSDRPT
jgi:peptide/nickel transport system substrate-binding protein